MATYGSIRYSGIEDAGISGATGSVAYASLGSFPSTPTEGDIAYAQDTNALYVYNGTAWARIDNGGESPVITTEPPTITQLLNSDGTTSTVTMTAQDPEGFDITYGIAYKTANNTRPVQLSADTTIDQSTGVFTFTPSTNSSNTGTFKARLSASDGAKITTRFVDFSLSFSEDIIFDSSEPGVSTTLTNTTTGWASAPTTPNDGMAQSNTLKTGKRYFEMYITASTYSPMIGIYPESNTDPGHNDTDGPAMYMLNGAVYPTGTFSAVGFDPDANLPSTLMIAFDTDARKVWFGLNGSWGSGSGDPISGTGYSVGGTGGFTLCVGSGQSNTTTLTSDILLGLNLTYAIPAGFQSQ